MNNMTATKIIISPKTKVGELLEAYPELESVLMSMSPAFEKLKNPLLRKTVARVATLQQVSIVGGVNIEDMIRQLRKEAGQDFSGSAYNDPDGTPEEKPEWLEISNIKYRLDATSKINSGESPMKEILQKAGILKTGEIFELTTPFVPAPIIEMLKSKGFKTYSNVNNDRTLTFITK
jgi:hypothetical protein